MADPAATHLVWDWNGTLFDDRVPTTAALHDAFVECGLPAVSQELYSANFVRPIRAFYERLLGRPLAAGEWERIEDAFRRAYRRRSASARLAADARAALDRWRGSGGTQSILSMAPHRELVHMVARLGLTPYFRRVEGNRDGDGRKAPHLARHLRRLGIAARQVVVIGDTVDDAAAAAWAGATAVLYSGGTTPRPAISAAGFPAADSLVEAVALALAPRRPLTFLERSR